MNIKDFTTMTARLMISRFEGHIRQKLGHTKEALNYYDAMGELDLHDAADRDCLTERATTYVELLDWLTELEISIGDI